MDIGKRSFGHANAAGAFAAGVVVVRMFADKILRKGDGESQSAGTLVRIEEKRMGQPIRLNELAKVFFYKQSAFDVSKSHAYVLS